jgi:hypothetical protein
MSSGIGSGREPPRKLAVMEQNEYETLLVQERAWLTRLWSPAMWSSKKFTAYATSYWLVRDSDLLGYLT